MPVLPDDELNKILDYTNSILANQDFSEDQIQSKLTAIARLFVNNDVLAQEIIVKYFFSKVDMSDLDGSESELNQQ